MRVQSFLHQSDSRYCYAISDTGVKVRLGVDKAEPLSKVYCVYGEDYRFGKDHREIEMKVVIEDAYYRYYEVILEAPRPSFLYVFRVYDEKGEDYYFSETGLSKGYIHDLSFISAFQIDAENEADYVKVPPSWEGRVFYNIFPERFAHGSVSLPRTHVNAPWDTRKLNGRPYVFLGGDLYGIKEKLPYLKSLGVGAIYLNPICLSPSNHKYDIVDYLQVDPRFGGNEAFRELASEAHALGMKVLLDMVFNHTSSDHPFFKDCLEKGKESPYYDWYFIYGDKPSLWKRNYRTFAAVNHMPKLNTSNPKVIDYLILVGKHWVEEGADGFRLDVSQGVSHAFWIRFKIALKEIKPDILLIGENWLNAESYLGPDQLDGVMDYPFLGIMSGYALRQKGALDTVYALNASLVKYKQGNNAMMLRLVSSHDIQRFFTLCKKDKGAYMCCYAILYFFYGFPMVYYGDEILMEGGNDPDCRRGMDWKEGNFKTIEFQTFQKLGQIRQEDALKSGDIHIEEKEGMVVISRKKDRKTFTLFANLSGKSKQIPSPNILFGYRLVAGQVADGGFAVVTETD